MGLSDRFARWQEAGYAPPTITETYDPDQVTVTVQVELARGKFAVKNAEKSVVQDEGAVKSAVKSSPLAKVAVKVAVKMR